MFYVAHNISYLKKANAVHHEVYKVFEIIFLIRASSVDEAFEVARRHGEYQEGVNSSTPEIDGVPGLWVFAGTRKITTPSDLNNKYEISAFAKIIENYIDDIGKDEILELSWNEYACKSESDVYCLSRGDTVDLAYRN